MIFTSRVHLLFFVAIVTLACQKNSKQAESETKWLDGMGPSRGHEDITRFAVDRANAEIQRLTGRRFSFDAVRPGESGFSSVNPLVRGVFETDFPQVNSELLTFYNETRDAWLESTRLQTLHFLRRTDNNRVQSAFDVCNESKKIITNAIHKAHSFWLNDHRRALYWTGHALHVVQDSFSPVHTRRSGNDFRRIDDVCVYDRDIAGVCRHEHVSLGDRIWQSTLACNANILDRSWECLKPEAQAAANASAGLLVALVRTRESKLELETLVNSYFHTTEGNFNGYFRCDSLKGR